MTLDKSPTVSTLVLETCDWGPGVHNCPPGEFGTLSFGVSVHVGRVAFRSWRQLEEYCLLENPPRDTTSKIDQ